MSRKKVAVICGGYTAEKNISLGSGNVAFNNIDRQQYEPYKIIVEEGGCFADHGRERVNLSDFSVVIGGNTIQFDLVFNAIHGSPGEDGKIQGYFDMLKIPYTNCNPATSALTFNKNWTKQVLGNEVVMAKGMLVTDDENAIRKAVEIIPAEYHLPVFVKPNNNGSSYGVSKVKDFAALGGAIREALKFDSEVLVEEGIMGTEVTCGVYRYQGKVIVLPVCEIVSGKHEFFDYTAKYTSGESDEIIPARIPAEDMKSVEDISAGIYTRLNCHGVVRIDYIIRDGQPFFLEVNTVPGLSEASIVPKMAVASGLTLSAFFGRLLEEATCG